MAVVEVVGKAGRIKIDKSQLEMYLAKGYVPCDESDIKSPAVVEESSTVNAEDEEEEEDNTDL